MSDTSGLLVNGSVLIWGLYHGTESRGPGTDHREARRCRPSRCREDPIRSAGGPASGTNARRPHPPLQLSNSGHSEFEFQSSDSIFLQHPISAICWWMPVLSPVEGPVLSQVEGPVLSPVERPVLSQVERSHPPAAPDHSRTAGSPWRKSYARRAGRPRAWGIGRGLCDLWRRVLPRARPRARVRAPVEVPTLATFAVKDDLPRRIPPAPRWGAVADWKTIRPLLLAALATAAAGALGALAYIKSGIYDVGAAKPHTKFTEWVTHETMIHSVRSHAKGIAAPASVSAAQVRRGFCPTRRIASPATALPQCPASNGSAGWSRARPICSTPRTSGSRASCSGSPRTGSR